MRTVLATLVVAATIAVWARAGIIAADNIRRPRAVSPAIANRTNLPARPCILAHPGGCAVNRTACLSTLS